MYQQVKKMIFIFLLLASLLIHKTNCDQSTDYSHSFYPKNNEKGFIYNSLKQLQDSVAQVNNNLFPSRLDNLFHSPINTKLYTNLYENLHNANNAINKRLGKPKKYNARLRIIQQLNREIIKNQLVAYEKFFNKLKRYDPDQMESRQAVNLIKTLFRFPVLLLFSNIFQLPLLPTLILASPFLNNPESGNTLANTLANSISKTPLSSAMANAVSSNPPASAQSLQTAASQQIATHVPFSLNPLVPINQLLNNFINEVIGDLQNTPLFNNLMQSVNQMLIKPNRLNAPNQLQNQLQNQPSIATQNQVQNSIQNQPSNSPIQSLNLSKPITINASDTDLLTVNASTASFAYQEPPHSYEPLPNIPLIMPVPGENAAGGSILNTLANSLLESNKNYQLTETLGVNNAGSIQELAMNAVNTLATMLKIKKQKKDLNSNEEMLLDFLTDKNYLQQVTSIGNLLKYGLKQKMEKEMNICLVRTICESNQKQISFAFDQLFSLAMHMTGMESRIEQSPWHAYYQIGRKMINEKNICKLIPKCRDDDEESEGKSLAEKKLNLIEKIEKIKKIEQLFSRRRESNLPDYQKPFRIMKKARKIRFAKRLFNRSFRKADKLTRRISKLLF